MLSSVAHSGCFKALDKLPDPPGSLPMQDILWIHCSLLWESRENAMGWALWSAVFLLVSWCSGLLVKQTNPSSCFAARSSPGVLYIEMGAGKGFLRCVLCPGVGTAQQGQFTEAPAATLCVCQWIPAVQELRLVWGTLFLLPWKTCSTTAEGNLFTL